MAEATSNSETLFNGLLELARRDSSRVSELQRRLLDPAVLDVLDSKADYETEMPEDLYIAGLIQALMDRGDAPAQKVLSQLTRSRCLLHSQSIPRSTGRGKSGTGTHASNYLFRR